MKFHPSSSETIQVNKLTEHGTKDRNALKLGIWLLFVALRMEEVKANFIVCSLEHQAMMSVGMMMNWAFIFCVRMTKTCSVTTGTLLKWISTANHVRWS